MNSHHFIVSAQADVFKRKCQLSQANLASIDHGHGGFRSEYGEGKENIPLRSSIDRNNSKNLENMLDSHLILLGSEESKKSGDSLLTDHDIIFSPTKRFYDDDLKRDKRKSKGKLQTEKFQRKMNEIKTKNSGERVEITVDDDERLSFGSVSPIECATIIGDTPEFIRDRAPTSYITVSSFDGEVNRKKVKTDF